MTITTPLALESEFTPAIASPFAWNSTHNSDTEISPLILCAEDLSLRSDGFDMGHRLAFLFFGSWLVIISSSKASAPATFLSESASATEEQQIFTAVESVRGAPFNAFHAFLVNAGRHHAHQSSFKSRGLELKSPMVYPSVTYKTLNDESFGGFDGDEVAGDISFDADIYSGLIAGIIYNHAYRSAQNDFNTDEHMNSNGVSLYGAKRLHDLVNVGASYNFTHADHRLSRGVTANLDCDSNGFILFGGLSNRSNKWSWGTTASFGYVSDDYVEQKDLETGRFAWNANVGYDFSKYVTLAGVINYYNIIFQNVFPGASIRDDDYYTLGPRILIYPNDSIVVHIDFDSMLGFNDISSHTLRTGMTIAF
jgi:hypothetical protein